MCSDNRQLKQDIDVLKRWLAYQLERFGSSGYLVCMSGGLDSATALKMSIDVVGKDKTFGLMCRIDGISNPTDLDQAKDYCEQLGITYIDFNITPIFEAYKALFPGMSPLQVHTCMARLRPVVAYSIADRLNLKIMGTANKSENLLQGWLHMTNPSDVIPFVQFSKSEIRLIARMIGVPTHFIEKEPNDSMINGGRDRDLFFGYDYDIIDPIVHALEIGDTSFLEKQDRKLVLLLDHQMKKTRWDTEFPVFIRSESYFLADS